MLNRKKKKKESSAKLANQTPKPVMLLSQVKLAGNVAIDSVRDRHEFVSVLHRAVVQVQVLMLE